jgi:hypothetical protein
LSNSLTVTSRMEQACDILGVCDLAVEGATLE